MATANELEGKLKGHEELCEERHDNIKRRLDKIEVKLDKLIQLAPSIVSSPVALTPLKIIAYAIAVSVIMATIALIATGHAEQVLRDLLDWG